jgi:hypothetical protein
LPQLAQLQAKNETDNLAVVQHKGGVSDKGAKSRAS